MTHGHTSLLLPPLLLSAVQLHLLLLRHRSFAAAPLSQRATMLIKKLTITHLRVSFHTQMVRPDGVEAMVPPPPGHYKAALLCTAFRAGAEVNSCLYSSAAA